MRDVTRYSTVAAIAASLMSWFGNADAADFYEGKTIKIITAGSPGGGQETNTRIVAEYMSRHIPGKPNVVVQNMFGGPGITMANHIFNVSPKDGTEIGQFLRDTPILPIVGAEAAKFKPDEFIWLGSPRSYSESAYVILIRSAVPYKGIPEMRKAEQPVVLGNNGTLLVPLVKSGLGANVKAINAYKSTELNLALERGEIDGMGSNYLNVIRETPHWTANNLIRFVVQMGHEKRLPQLPDVPTARELAQTPDDLALVKFAELPLTLGYPFALPPGVPADRVAIIRKAFNDTMVDPGFIAALDKAGIEYSPQSGEELGGKIKDAARTSKAVLARYNALVTEAGASSP